MGTSVSSTLSPNPWSPLPSSDFHSPSKVGRSQTADGVPVLDGLETINPALSIVPAKDIVQTFEPFGIQPRVEEPQREAPRQYGHRSGEGPQEPKSNRGTRISER